MQKKKCEELMRIGAENINAITELQKQMTNVLNKMTDHDDDVVDNIEIFSNQ